MGVTPEAPGHVAIADAPVSTATWSPWTAFALLPAVIAVVLVVREPKLFTHPVLDVDDGRFTFAYFYQNRALAELLAPWAGYVHLPQNIVAFASVRLPTRWAPYAITWFPLALMVAAHSLFYARRFRGIIASDRARAIVCLLTAILPNSNYLLVSNTNFSIWSSLLVLALLSLAPPPRSALAALLEALGAALLAWSHPLSIVVAPIAALRGIAAARSRSWAPATHQAIVLGACLSYQLCAVQHEVARPQNAIDTALALLHYTSGRVIAEPAVSSMLIELAPALLVPIVHAASLAVAVAIAHALRERRAHGPAELDRWAPLLLIYYAFAISAGAVVGRGLVVEPNFGGWLHRYFFVQQTLFVVLFSMLLEPFVTRWMRNRESARKTLLIAATWIALLNALDGYAYRGPDGADKVAAFIDELARLEERGGELPPGGLRLERHAWSIQIDRLPR